MKGARERLQIINAYRELGSYRAAAEVCGTTHKTVRRVVERQQTGPPERVRRPRSTDPFVSLIVERVGRTQGRISAKRLFPAARAAGYEGSARHFRRAVAEAKAAYRRERVLRPWTPGPGSHLVVDWADTRPFPLFCAVLPWSRWRFVRFALNQRRETVLGLLAECFEAAGGVPAVVLSDRMAALKASVVANAVVPHPDYVRFALRYGFRPDFCEAEDPVSKGIVEALVGYAKQDLIVPAEGGWATLDEANAAAVAWCEELNGRRHSETTRVPSDQLALERECMRPLPSLRPPLRAGERRKVDRLGCVRFGSARYSVPHELVGSTVEVGAIKGEVVIVHADVEVARHPLVAPGEVSLKDEHYGGPRRGPTRALRPRSAAERAFLSLGPLAEQYLRAAAAAGTARLTSELREIVALEQAWGSEALLAALERALLFRRYRAEDVRAILAAGAGVPTPRPAGSMLPVSLPSVPTRPLSAYALEALR